MRNRWNDRQLRGAGALPTLIQRSRWIGEEDALGLYGGGNTSLKATAADVVLGRAQPVLWVKASGSHLKGCGPQHFAALQLTPLQRLVRRRTMGDAPMVAFLERCQLHPRAPRPSVETLLHAFLPEAAVDHTHADAILALANTHQGQRLVRRVLGPRLIWLPYIQPGFALSREVALAYRRHPGADGAVLQHHGLVTWGPDGRTSYARTIHYVTAAERFLARAARTRAWSPMAVASLPEQERMALLRQWLPAVRRTLSRKRKVCLALTDTPDVLAFVNAKRMPALARTGPATPDHMLRTKRLPCIIRAPRGGVRSLSAATVVRQLDAYAAAHARYVRAYRRGGGRLQDPYPRVILVPGVGMLTAGKDATDAGMVADVYRHAIWIMRHAAAVGRYTSVTARQAFGVEYWPLELYKLTLAPPEQELSREVVLITGAAGGIGQAIAQTLLDRGASVVATDLDQAAVDALAARLNAHAGRRRALGLAMDVTDEASIARAFDATRRTFGGLDVVVSNAGVAAVAAIDRLPPSEWERCFAVNATGHFLVARAAIPWLRAQGLGGALVFIASKNVLAPGRDFGAYSAAKAAQTQLARVLAIENGEAGIRVNVVNPDGVFDGSGLWRAIAADRARTYGLRPGALAAYYRNRNLLKVPVLPHDVAEAVGFLVSQRAAKTTGCILTVDGGLREAFPR